MQTYAWIIKQMVSPFLHTHWTEFVNATSTHNWVGTPQLYFLKECVFSNYLCLIQSTRKDERNPWNLKKEDTPLLLGWEYPVRDGMQFATHFDMQLTKILSHDAWFDFFFSRTSWHILEKTYFWYSWTVHFSFYANWGSDVLWTEFCGQDTQGDKLTLAFCIACASAEPNHYFFIVVCFSFLLCLSRVSGVLHRRV